MKQTEHVDLIDLDEILNGFPKEFVDISSQEQELAINLYQLLALGEPVSIKVLSDKSKMPLTDVNHIINEWLGVFHDDVGKIIAFWGMGLAETQHKILTGGRIVYAWCAWDTLFLPALIGGATVQITSRCAQSGENIRLNVNLEHLVSVSPKKTMLSFVAPNEDGIRKDIIGNFCHSVLYFASPQLGAQWVLEHPGTFLMSVEKAFELAQMINRRKFPNVGNVRTPI